MTPALAEFVAALVSGIAQGDAAALPMLPEDIAAAALSAARQLGLLAPEAPPGHPRASDVTADANALRQAILDELARRTS